MALVLLASIVWFTTVERRFMPREILIGLFLTVTTPVTLILLARAALFRAPGHKHFRECGDQILRNFLRGLTLRERGKAD